MEKIIKNRWIRITFLFIFLVIYSCSSNSASSSLNKENQGSTESMIKDFYIKYITYCDTEDFEPDSEYLVRVEKEYLTDSLRFELKNQTLEYDPILNAQDCDKDWIKTLKVEKDSKENNRYIVNYTPIDQEQVTIIVDVKKDINKKTRINGFSSTLSRQEYNDLLNNTCWSVNSHSIPYINTSVVGIQMTFKNYELNTTIDSTNNLYFNYPIIGPIPEDMMDCQDYSEEDPIGKIEFLDDGSLKVTWYGFYNIKTKEKVHTQNPFGGKETFTILHRCTDN